MALFSKKEKTVSSVQDLHSIVVKTENVSKELFLIAKEYDLKQESLDFDLLEVHTFTRFVQNESEGEWEEIDNARLHEIDQNTLLDPNFQIKQVYEIEVFSKHRNKNPLFEEFKIAIGSNASKCKVYMRIKEDSTLRYFSALQEELKIYINKHKVRAGVLVYIFDEMLDDVVSKLAAKARVEETLFFEEPKTILIAESIEPTKTTKGSLVLHYQHQNEEDEDGRVDYSNRGFIQNVYKDDLLLEYIKPRPGKPGRDCMGRYIAPQKPKENNDLGFRIDEETIYIVEDEHSIRYYAKKNGYIAFEKNTYTIKSEVDVNQISFKTTGSIAVGDDSDVSLVVTESNAIKDAIGMGMKVEVTKLDVEGNVGSDAKVKALKATVRGQTHKDSLIEADEININIHKGTAKGKKVRITRLEHGVVEAESVRISQVVGGRIFAEEVFIEICGSYVRIRASRKIEIKKMRGSENIFTIDPLQQRESKEGYEKNKEQIEQIKAELHEHKKMINTYTRIVKKDLPVYNDVKKHLIYFKRNGLKPPEAYVKQYKNYQSQINKLKELQEEYQRLEEKLHLFTNQASVKHYDILDARIINHDRWLGYNELHAKLLDPPIEIVYKPQENESYHVYGVVEVGEDRFALQPLKEEL